jgi:hypothetical protein
MALEHTAARIGAMKGFQGDPGRPARRTGAYWPTRTQELLLRAALLDGSEAVAAWRAVEPTLDVNRLGKAARRLLPLLGHNLRRHGLGEGAGERLAPFRRQAALENQRLFEAGRRILQALGEAGIDTLVLKGGALAATLYSEPSLRPMGDLDILVPTAQADAALERLATVGWRPITPVPPAFVQEQHAVDLVSEDRSTKCDLHWRVYWESWGPGVDESLWAASVPLDFEGVRTRMLSPADQLLHVCVHGSRRVRRPGLLWIPDTVLLLRAGGIDWERLIAEAARRRFVMRTATMLDYVAGALAAPVPTDVLGRLRGLPVSRLERLEYWVGNRPPGLLGALPTYWCNYRRLCRSGRPASPLGFPRYLQQTWRTGSLPQTARAALVRAAHRLATAFVGASPLDREQP